MILKSFKSYLSLLILLIFCFPVTAEDKIDIWKNNKQNSEIPEPRTQNSIEVKPKQKTIRVETNNDEIKIEDSINDKIDEVKVYGIYDPADYNFNLIGVNDGRENRVSLFPNYRKRTTDIDTLC